METSYVYGPQTYLAERTSNVGIPMICLKEPSSIDEVRKREAKMDDYIVEVAEKCKDNQLRCGLLV